MPNARKSAVKQKIIVVTPETLFALILIGLIILAIIIRVGYSIFGKTREWHRYEIK